MSKEMAVNVVKMLCTEFKKNFPEAGMKLVFPTLCEADEKALEAAYDYFVLNNRFPSPQQLKDQVIAEGKKIVTEQSRQRESEWAATKGGSTRRELERAGSIFSREQADRHGKEAVKAIKLMMNPDVDRQHKLECFKAMDAAYPNVGWATEGMKLKRFWEEGRPL